ncbi:hypothetical protein Ahy_B06g083972 [Arachis hypogaea]|uniref:Protein FAR1-RELATED SEQUENCE n=1 Tax=Arachis hypogaea TaxID=3818 RepID=A0A444YQW1_ARAHY|nr:hypothetical protein Ahy_B06g083972 [Arachis hypogaea]
MLCCHSLFVLGIEKVKKLLDKYILNRWKKTLKRKHSSIKSSHDPSGLEPLLHLRSSLKPCVVYLTRFGFCCLEPKASKIDNVDNQHSNEVNKNTNCLEIHNP